MSDRYEQVFIYDADGEVVGDYVERVPDFGDYSEEPPDDYGDDGCPGHYDDDSTLMSGVGTGEPTFCDGSCRPSWPPQGWDAAPASAGGYSDEPPF